MIPRSLYLALALAISFSNVSAFSSLTTPSARAQVASALQASSNDDCCGHSSQQQRRAFLSSIFTAASVTLTTTPAYAGLLDDYGADPTVDKQPAKEKKVQAVNKGKQESNMEPNLRSNYYYPTNKGMCTATAESELQSFFAIVSY